MVHDPETTETCVAKKRKNRGDGPRNARSRRPETPANPYAVVVWHPEPERPRTRHEVMTAVCDRIEAGELVEEAAWNEGTTRKTIWEWARKYPDLGDVYARAREASAEVLEQEAIRVARTLNMFPQNMDTRLLVDTLKWAAAKRRPKVYADRVDHYVLPKDPRDMTDEEVAAHARVVRAKLRLVR